MHPQVQRFKMEILGYILFFWVMTFTNGMFLSSNSTFNNIYQTIEQFSNQCLTDAEILRCKLIGNFCDPKTKTVYCATKKNPFENLKSGISFVEIGLEITRTIHVEMAKLDRHIIIQSCKKRANLMKKLRKSLIEMQLVLMKSKTIFNDRGINSNTSTTIFGYDYVYKFDASLSTLPDCMLPNENNITNQSYVAVNQLLGLFHLIRVKANLLRNLLRPERFKSFVGIQRVVDS